MTQQPTAAAMRAAEAIHEEARDIGDFEVPPIVTLAEIIDAEIRPLLEQLKVASRFVFESTVQGSGKLYVAFEDAIQKAEARDE